MCVMVQVHWDVWIEKITMILNDASELLQSLGARKIRGKELTNLHGVYGYMMVMEEVRIPEFNGSKTLSSINQRFIALGAYQDSGHLLIERSVWIIADIENIPVIIVVYGYFEPQIHIYNPDEVLTRHRENTGNMFGVVGIEFPLNLGEKIDSLEGLRVKWLKMVKEWATSKKDAKRKVQKKIKSYRGLPTSTGSSMGNRMWS